jgi:DNA-binding Xre family transcriptional regulator
MKAGTVTVKPNLNVLKTRLEAATGKQYSWLSLAYAVGLNPSTVYKLARNETNSIRFDTIQALLTFSNREGLQIELCDLFVVEPSRIA